jgi:hypothetical protein
MYKINKTTINSDKATVNMTLIVFIKGYKNIPLNTKVTFEKYKGM